MSADQSIGGPCKLCGRTNLEHPGGQCTRSFDEAFSEHNLTPAEKHDLIVYLASLRMAATLKAFGVTKEQG